MTAIDRDGKHRPALLLPKCPPHRWTYKIRTKSPNATVTTEVVRCSLCGKAQA
jgi:hypothetical protein